MHSYRSIEPPPRSDPGPVPDRRRDVRHATTLQVAKLASDRGEELCILRDISSGGAKAAVYCPMTPGDRVVLALKTAHEIAGHVAWCDDDVVGITFDQRVAVLELLAHRALNRFGHRIRLPRLAVDLAAELEIDGSRTDVRIRDVSQAGMRIALNHVVKGGQHCHLLVPALGRRSAIVRWSRNAEAGIALKQPLVYPEFAAWRRALNESAALQEEDAMVAEHTPEPLPPSMLAAAHLRAPALLFRRLESADGTAAIDELVATAPLMLIASTILSLEPAERRRHWVSTSLGKLESDEVIAIAGEWWGQRYGPHHDGDLPDFVASADADTAEHRPNEPASAPTLPPLTRLA